MATTVSIAFELRTVYDRHGDDRTDGGGSYSDGQLECAGVRVRVQPPQVPRASVLRRLAVELSRNGTEFHLLVAVHRHQHGARHRRPVPRRRPTHQPNADAALDQFRQIRVGDMF